MSRYIKSVTEASKLNDNLEELKQTLKNQAHATRRNNRELQKLNEYAKEVSQDKIMKLEVEIKQMKEDQKWVQSEEPAIDVTPDYLMKKLNII